MSEKNYTYKTIIKQSEGIFRDRGSKFIAYAKGVDTKEDAQMFLQSIRKDHPKSRHLCHGIVIGNDYSYEHISDDGEPSGTAGRPILGQLHSFGLTNIVVGVIRYFGGTKLGTSGLINAYKLSTQFALETATIKTYHRKVVYSSNLAHQMLPMLYHVLSRFEGTIEEKKFTDQQAEVNIIIPMEAHEKKIMQILQNVFHLDAETHAEELAERAKLQFLGEII